ncbi:MAG: hypothetical protein KC910_23755, partial [Candidatus Eremiobacteraeota bacterium]|nr:hypothetical protein [Candidatus Eremiobacteraeota bacterium]
SYSRKYLEEASRLSHGDPDIYALLIDQVRHEGGSLEEGEKYLRAGQKLDPTSYHLQGQYARLLQARGRNWRDAVERPEDLLYIQRYLPKLRVPKDFALECYQQTATSHPRSTYVRNALAKAAMDAKEFDLAAEAFSQLGDRVELYVWRPREFYRQRNRLIEMGYQVDTKTFAPLPSLPPECAGVDIDQDLLSIQVSELFSGEFYPELDAVAGVYRAKKTRFVNFDSKLGTLYAALESEKLSDLALWERSVLFERWRKLCPDSPTAATGSVSTAISEAWEVRGGGYADSVSKKQWEGFSERLQMADSYFQAAIRSGKPTDGFLYAHAITIGMGTSAPREVVEHWLDEARAIDPWEPAPFDAMYNYLLPRWHGSPSAVKKFLGGLKPPMFAMVACKDIEDSEMSREQAIERIAAGFVHLAKAHPSRENWSRALFFATGCANQDLARTCFANLQGNWSAEWVSCQNHYDRLKRKAYQGTE